MKQRLGQRGGVRTFGGGRTPMSTAAISGRGNGEGRSMRTALPALRCIGLFYESMSRRNTPTHLIASSSWHQPRCLCTTEPTADCLREAAPAVKTVAPPFGCRVEQPIFVPE